jgi:molybdopterin-binding protein
MPPYPRAERPIRFRRKPVKISARNQLKGTIIEITKGATTAHVRLDVGGTIVTSAITNAAVEELELAVGQQAYAVVKASDVMIAID